MARTGQQLRQRTAKAMAQPKGAAAPAGARPVREPRSSLGDRMRYRFDNSMSRGTPALIAWLSVATLVLILLFTVVVTALRLRRGGSDGFFREMVQTLFHALDPGTVAGDADSPWRFLLTMLLLTIAGLFIVSALIGVIAAGIDTKLADLRRGRSIVLEKDHTVILGWSDSIFTIVRELTIANESRRKPVIVILADRDKVEMEDELRAKVADLRGTRVVCRNGSPMDIDDLRLSSHVTARSVILLAPEDSEDPDSEVIKTLLALTHAGPDGPRIVAEIRNPSNLEAARLVGAERTVLVDIRETVAKLVVQTSRQSGAAAVYTELFDYGGDEIYFLDEHSLDGSTYAEVQLAFEEATVIGVIADGVPKLNPPPETVIAGHTLIVVAEDDSVLRGDPDSTSRPDLGRLGTGSGQDDHPTQALLIGWNERAPIVLRELDHYAPVGSTLTVLTSFDVRDVPRLKNLLVTVVPGPTTDRGTLEQYVRPDLDQVLVLCYSDHLEPQAADARTLVTLLHVRDILGRYDDAATPVVSEMLDDRNRVLAQVAHVDDVVVSGEIVSLLVTQLSEDHRLEAVFDQLLGDEGSEIYLRPAEWYVAPGAEVSYATIIAGAARRNETAIGYKSEALADGDASFGVRVNPAKSETFRVLAGDRVVVLADD
ncbi:CASTOR/POLLUX-related putative ion channel [Nocardioides sp. URHA0032]|uniref:CASTOR/POLLUX-related putative ion channel n=1 Tax=Nocardioides sp. URHA0032 TaxID=1380388 RepID=UPI00068738A6|nr:NAD-binding protein [Nocardioides sp. URHA0032]